MRFDSWIKSKLYFLDINVIHRVHNISARRMHVEWKFTIRCNEECTKRKRSAPLRNWWLNFLFYHYRCGWAIKLKLQRSNVLKRFRRFVAHGCLPTAHVYSLVFWDSRTLQYVYIHFVTSWICRSAALCICCMCNASNCVAFSCYADVISVDLAEQNGVSTCGKSHPDDKNGHHALHNKCIILRRIHPRNFTRGMLLASRQFVDSSFSGSLFNR